MKFLKKIGLAIVLGLTLSTSAYSEKAPVKIGYYSYSDVLFTTNVVAYILQHKMHRKVQMTKAYTGAIYQDVANGNLDFFTESWLPDTHADYVKKVERRIWSVGALYTGARLGWVVPDYVPKDKLNSIEDLKSEGIKKKLGGRIVGIGPGAGLTKLSKKAMKTYRLKKFGYTLQISSGPAMTAELKRAIANKKWIVVTGWSPHWMFARWKLRYLHDPKGIVSSRQHIETIVHRGFYREMPRVFELLTRMYMPLKDVQWGMNEGQKTTYQKAAKKYVENHPSLVHYWVTGDFPESRAKPK